MMFGGGLGEAGAEVVVEEFLAGEEASFFALCDGETAIPLASAQDHKRVFDGDRGPNTGGMGAYSPAPVMTPEMSRRAMDEIVLPTVRAMKAMGAPYKGVLFAGLMITAEGPKLIEYNVRFGDPECQVLMLRLMSDLVPALLAAARRHAEEFRSALVSGRGAHRGHGRQGLSRQLRQGLGDRRASTRRRKSRAWKFSTPAPRPKAARILANGGRVLNVCSALGKTRAAVDRAQDGFCRRDIVSGVSGGSTASAGRTASAAATSELQETAR